MQKRLIKVRSSPPLMKNCFWSQLLTWAVFLDISGILLGIFFDFAGIVGCQWPFGVCGLRNGRIRSRCRCIPPSRGTLFSTQAYTLDIRLRAVFS